VKTREDSRRFFFGGNLEEISDKIGVLIVGNKKSEGGWTFGKLERLWRSNKLKLILADLSEMDGQTFERI
jgi:hypothetical protein